MLVAVGAFSAVDQWAVDHAMPGLDPEHVSEPSLVDALKPFGDDREPLALAADAWLYPASVLLSVLIVGGCAIVLWRRGERRAALAWPAAGAASGVAELLTKGLLVRPALTTDGVHVEAFDQALPSGHTLRSVLIAATVAYTWRRAAAPAALWAATVPPLLVVAGWHVPLDVVAGLVLAAALVLAAREHAQAARVDPRARAAVLARDDEPRPREPQP